VSLQKTPGWSRRRRLPEVYRLLADRSHGEAKPHRLQHGIHAFKLGIPFWRQRSIERRRIEFGLSRELRYPAERFRYAA